MGQFNLYTTATTIDGANDLFLKYEASSGVLKTISRNTIMGVTGQPADISTSQTFTNKTIGITNTITSLDTLFTLQDNGDNTKQLQFQLSGITTSTIRTLTIPDRTSTIATLDGGQTFTGANSFTGSTWSGGTISNPTLLTDAVTGFTVTNSGTVYGIAVSLGVISGANTISGGALTTNSIPAGVLETGAVSGANLSTTAITLGSATNTSNVTTASTTAVQFTGLTTTVTIPAGGRKIKITAFLSAPATNIAARAVELSIWDGIVAGGGTQIGSAIYFFATANVSTTCLAIIVVSPSAGSKTYNVGWSIAGGAGTLSSSSTSVSPDLLLVEAI